MPHEKRLHYCFFNSSAKLWVFFRISFPGLSSSLIIGFFSFGCLRGRNLLLSKKGGTNSGMKAVVVLQKRRMLSMNIMILPIASFGPPHMALKNTRNLNEEQFPKNFNYLKRSIRYNPSYSTGVRQKN